MKRPLWRWEMKPVWKIQNLQCLEWPLEAERETIHRKANVKMPNFTAEININTFCCLKQMYPNLLYNTLIYINISAKVVYN